MLKYNDLTPGTLLGNGIVCDHSIPMFGDLEATRAKVVALSTWIALRRRELQASRSKTHPRALLVGDIEIEIEAADVLRGYRRLP